MNARPSSLERLLSGHRRVALDSNVLIYLAADVGARAETAARLIQAVARLDIDLVVATIGVAEVLTGPARAGDAQGFERLADELMEVGLRVVALDQQIAEDAAWLRGRIGLDLVDAIHLATAKASGSTLFVTNDRGIPRLPGLEVVYFDDLVA